MGQSTIYIHLRSKRRHADRGVATGVDGLVRVEGKGEGRGKAISDLIARHHSAAAGTADCDCMHDVLEGAAWARGSEAAAWRGVAAAGVAADRDADRRAAARHRISIIPVLTGAESARGDFERE